MKYNKKMQEQLDMFYKNVKQAEKPENKHFLGTALDNLLNFVNMALSAWSSQAHKKNRRFSVSIYTETDNSYNQMIELTLFLAVKSDDRFFLDLIFKDSVYMHEKPEDSIEQVFRKLDILLIEYDKNFSQYHDRP
jgi:hypothetical protein